MLAFEAVLREAVFNIAFMVCDAVRFKR